VLDHYGTVAAAVSNLREEPFYVAPTMTPDGKEGALHLAISDTTGDSAIFEHIGGKLVIHHGRQYQVMTNSPIYDQQLALEEARIMLPNEQTKEQLNHVNYWTFADWLGWHRPYVGPLAGVSLATDIGDRFLRHRHRRRTGHRSGKPA
jgi:penicillin V acylase-like amidase (Ntn superfamily)